MARELALRFAKTAVERDRLGGTPKLERDALRESGLLKLWIPRELGGDGAGWPEVLELVRLFARVDGSLAHVFGFHHLMLATARLFGAPAQWRSLLERTASQGWFWGNALNPLDTRTSLTPSDGAWVLEGMKSFSSGSSDAEMLIASALRSDTGKLVVFALPASRAGVRVLGDWDNMGQRQTDSGSVELKGVRVEQAELLETPGPLGSVFASLRPCLAQLILVNVYLGIAEGALGEAAEYTRTQRRAWPGSGVESATRDPYVLAHYGEMQLQLEGSRLLADHAVERLERAWQAEDALTAAERGEVALAIATAKVQATRTGLDVTSRMFEVMGARSTVASLRLDRYWRNLRTHSLHDPVDYKLRELGEYALNGLLPTPSFYS